MHFIISIPTPHTHTWCKVTRLYTVSVYLLPQASGALETDAVCSSAVPAHITSLCMRLSSGCYESPKGAHWCIYLEKARGGGVDWKVSFFFFFFWVLRRFCLGFYYSKDTAHPKLYWKQLLAFPPESYVDLLAVGLDYLRQLGPVTLPNLPTEKPSEGQRLKIELVMQHLLHLQEKYCMLFMLEVYKVNFREDLDVALQVGLK